MSTGHYNPKTGEIDRSCTQCSQAMPEDNPHNKCGSCLKGNRFANRTRHNHNSQ